MRGDLKSANLYRLRGTTITGDAAVISNSLSTSDATNLWHMRLGHMSELGLAVLSKRGLLDGHSINKLDFCEHCVFDKHKRVKFNTATHSIKGILDYVHSYLWGPYRSGMLRCVVHQLMSQSDPIHFAARATKPSTTTSARCAPFTI
jgi:hypothetical protein